VTATRTVVVVPGLWVSPFFMRPLAWRLEAAGFAAARFGYRSVRATLEANADALVAFCRGRAGPLDFVAHSLGGAIVATALERAPDVVAHRCVLIGTPFAECHAGRRLARYPGGATILGRSLPRWLAQTRPALGSRCEVGVIAGSMRAGLGCLVATDLPRPNDGVIALEETAVPAMRDRIVLPVSHTAMMFSARVAREAGLFLRDGRFSVSAPR
jgi:pimeloyl-ACP methyl ester carboxylesterase